MTVLLVTSDLMTASRVTGAAQALGINVDVAGSAEEVSRKTADGEFAMVILDLASPAADIAIVARLRELSPAPHILAFGPHVHAEKLAAASAAGCDEVLTRGEFYARLDQILQRSAD